MERALHDPPRSMSAVLTPPLPRTQRRPIRVPTAWQPEPGAAMPATSDRPA